MDWPVTSEVSSLTSQVLIRQRQMAHGDSESCPARPRLGSESGLLVLLRSFKLAERGEWYVVVAPGAGPQPQVALPCRRLQSGCGRRNSAYTERLERTA
jgi:hypothetical protein